MHGDHRICFIGDSYIQGTSDPECRGWVGRVSDRARARDVSELALRSKAVWGYSAQAVGKGHGRTLLEHAVQQARATGARRLAVHSDPNAEGFYVAAGARVTGQSESGSIPGRMLPTLVLDLD